MMATTILSNGVQVRLAACVNCQRVRPIISRGRCSGCYKYFHRHGCDRSPASIREGSSRRRCDCGQVAVASTEIQVGRSAHLRTMTIWLCNDCLKLEQQK